MHRDLSGRLAAATTQFQSFARAFSLPESCRSFIRADRLIERARSAIRNGGDWWEPDIYRMV
ncbi:hypothetical protein, partial [Rhizobium brockwellii]|uniref:hypothetical protein n=1 Tax=Rhizobium brockwellii TaxID=3019932 RepID=UPI003F958733